MESKEAPNLVKVTLDSQHLSITQVSSSQCCITLAFKLLVITIKKGNSQVMYQEVARQSQHIDDIHIAENAGIEETSQEAFCEYTVKACEDLEGSINHENTLNVIPVPETVSPSSIINIDTTTTSSSRLSTMLDQILLDNEKVKTDLVPAARGWSIKSFTFREKVPGFRAYFTTTSSP